MTDILHQADQAIVAASGVADWRPLFLMGLGTVAVVVFAVLGLVALLRWSR